MKEIREKEIERERKRAGTEECLKAQQCYPPTTPADTSIRILKVSSTHISKHVSGSSRFLFRPFSIPGFAAKESYVST